LAVLLNADDNGISVFVWLCFDYRKFINIGLGGGIGFLGWFGGCYYWLTGNFLLFSKLLKKLNACPCL
jgi:hypothetical protein